jgi:lysyl-tRNA synthetase class 2
MYRNAMWWKPEAFEKKKQFLSARQSVVRAVRAFFDDQGFYEVETPALQVAPGMEPHLHAFCTRLLNPERDQEQTLYLHTSPEFAMKKLLVAGLPKIYQICHVFRNAEGSRLHSPEFSMIEWYRANAGYRDIMQDCIGLLRAVANAAGATEYRYCDMKVDPFGDWEMISVTEAFQQYARIDLTLYLPHPDLREGGSRGDGFLESQQDVSNPSLPNPPSRKRKGRAFIEVVAALGLHTASDDTFEDLFYRVMGEVIEPKLGQGRPTIIYDYPVQMAALSRPKPEDPRFAERFELYVCGVELANAFGELTDAKTQRQRFIADMDLKEKIYGERWPLDEDFIAALEHGMPESGGIALGIDRLVMLATGAEDIKQVLWTE